MTTLALGVLALAAAVFALVYFGRWVFDRAEERSAAASFECAFIPDSSEVDDAATDELLNEVRAANEAAAVAEAEAIALIEESVVLLEDARAHVERLRRAAGQ